MSLQWIHVREHEEALTLNLERREGYLSLNIK